MKEVFRYGFILGAVCFISATMLAVTNAITEPKIKLQKEEEESAAPKEVMPEAVSFKAQSDGGKVSYYSVYDEKNILKGFVLKSAGTGYSSNIEVLTGLTTGLMITSIKILSQSETPGLGTRIMSPVFKEQFRGKGPDDLGEVDAITGATISSSAVINSIKGKIAELKERLLEEAGSGR